MRGVQTFVDLAAATGCDGVSFSPMRTWRGTLDAFRLSGTEAEELCRSLKGLRPRLRKLKLTHNISEMVLRYEVGEDVWAKTRCYVPWIHARVRIGGTVQACQPCDLPLGNLNEASFASIWNNSAYRSLRRRLLRDGPEFAAGVCDCAYCCHITDNMRIHRFFRWLAPLAGG